MEAKIYYNKEEITSLKQLETLVEEAFVYATRNNEKAKFNLSIMRSKDGSFKICYPSFYYRNSKSIVYMCKDYSILHFGTRKQTKVGTICFAILKYIEDEITNPDRERQYKYPELNEEQPIEETTVEEQPIEETIVKETETSLFNSFGFGNDNTEVYFRTYSNETLKVNNFTEIEQRIKKNLKRIKNIPLCIGYCNGKYYIGFKNYINTNIILYEEEITNVLTIDSICFDIMKCIEEHSRNKTI